MSQTTLIMLVLIGSLTSIVAEAPPRIEQNPASVLVVNISDPVTLECRVSGDPQPVVTWFKNGNVLDVAGKNEYTLLRNTDLFIVSAKVGRGDKSDSGDYYCKAKNSLGEVESSKASLLVAYLKDDFREIPKSRQITSGSSVVMDCIAPRGSPEPIIWWEKNGSPLQLNTQQYRAFDNGTFLIPNATLVDNGEYRCVAQNDAGLRRSAPAFLNVFEKPSFLLKPQTKKYQTGATVRLECQAKGFPQPLIEWKKDNSLDNMPPKAQISDNTLILPSVSVNDEGEYTCLASNQLGSVEASAFLVVYEKPVFTRTMSNLTIGIESKSLTIECNARGKPQPVIYWAKSGQPSGEQAPTAGQEDFIILENGNLFIERLSRKYEGTYLCQASNEYGSIETKTSLLMKPVQSRPPPIIVYGPQNQTIPINTQATLECLTTTAPNLLFEERAASTSDRNELQTQYLSNEKVKITWFKDNTQLNIQYPKYKLHDTGSLEIASVQTTDSGLYKCVATNFFGQTSSMPALLTIENPNNQYAEFQRNFETTALPSAPTQPVILLATATSVSLSWQASSHSGHSPLVSYSIEYFSPEWPERLPGWITAARDLPAVSSFTVENLQPDTYYMFMVRARNSQGYGPPSKVSDLSKTLFEPDAVSHHGKNSNEVLERALTGEVVQLNEPALVLSSSSVSVTWKILKSASLIEGFYVKYKPIGAKHAYTTLTITDKRARTSVLTDLSKFTPYEILVEPFSGSIRGSESNIVQAKTLEDLPSRPPADLHVQLDSETSMSVKWQAPPPGHLNGLVLGYKIACLANETKFSLNLNTNATTRAIIVGNLIKDMKYCVRVAAFTRKGTGPFSPETCLVMSNAFMANFDVTRSRTEAIQDVLAAPWFILILVAVCLVASLLVCYCIWCVLRRLVTARKHRAFLSASSENGSLTDTNNHLHKIDSGNRYKLVTDNNIWLDTLHSGSNQSNQECCCVPDLHHQIFAQQSHNGAGRHLLLHHADTCTQHTASTNSQPNSNNSSQQPQYAEIYGPPPINQANPYATAGLFADHEEDTNKNNPYNMINYQTLNANRQQLLQNSYTLKLLAEQLQQTDGQIGPAMTMLNDQKKLLKYLQQQSTQSHNNTPRTMAKNLQNRVKSENHANATSQRTTNSCYHGQQLPFHSQHQMIAYLADSHNPNSSSTPIPSLPLAPPPSLASALIAQQHHTQLSAHQQKQLIDGYNNLLTTLSRGQQQQSPVQYNMPWNGANASAFTSARLPQSTLMRAQQQQAASTFTAQQYANRAKQSQEMQQDYSSISPVEDLAEAELEHLTGYKKQHQQHSWASVTDSNPISSSYESSQATNQMGGNSLNSSDLSKRSAAEESGVPGQQQHYANHDLDDEKKNRFVPILKNGGDEANDLYISDMVQTIL